MKKNWSEFWQQLLITQYNHWCLYCLALAFMYMGVHFAEDLEQPDVFGWALFGVVPLIQYYIRKYLKNNMGVIAAHIVLVFAPVLLPLSHLFLRVIFAVFSVGYFIFSLKKHFSEIPTKPKAFHLSVGFASAVFGMLCAEGLACEGYEMIYIILVMGLTVLYFLCYFTEHYGNFVMTNSKSVGYMPKRQILFSGLRTYFMVSFFCVLFSVFLMNTTIVDNCFALVKKLVRAIFGFIGLLFPAGETKEAAEEELLQEVQTKAEQFFPPMEKSWMQEVLQWIGQAVAYAVLLLIIVLMIRACVKLIRELLQVKHTDHEFDIRERYYEKKKENEKRSQRTLFWGQLSTRERIRRLFRQSMLRDKELLLSDGAMHNRLEAYTPSEYATVSQKEEVTAIYEKVRYSDLTCTKEDYKKMKEACK